MTVSARGTLFGLLVTALLTSLVLWLSLQLGQAAQRAQEAERNLEECAQAAREIVRLRQQPTQATSRLRTPSEILSLLETTLQRQNLPQSTVVSTDAVPAARVGDSAYRVQSTAVLLKPLKLPQIVGCLLELTEGDPTLTIGTLRLSTPREAGNSSSSELWKAEFTLTQLVYDPVNSDAHSHSP